MVTRCIYSSVSTHTLISSPYLLVYPLSCASPVTHMLTLSEDRDTALGSALFTEPHLNSHGPWLSRGFPPLYTTAHRPVLKIPFCLWLVSLQVGLWLGLVYAFSSK